MTDEASNLYLFDANCMLGRMIAPKPGFPLDASQLLDVMDRFGIAEAMVYHSQSLQYDPARGNAALKAEIEGIDRLHAVWVLLPAHTGEFPHEDLFLRQMAEQNVKAARLFPGGDNHNFSLKPYCAGRLLRGLESVAMPLFIDQNQIGWDDVYDICRDYPELPLVLTGVSYRVDRFLYPLMEMFDNLHVELSYYHGHREIEALAERFGARRLLFGSNLPYYTPGAAIAMLAYARLKAAERRLITGENLKTLINRVKVKYEHPRPRPLSPAVRQHTGDRLPRTPG